MDVCPWNTTGKADARDRTSTEGSLEILVCWHACMLVFAEQGWDHHEVDDAQLRSVHLHSFSDASHAPYRFNKRKGVSGGAVFFERSLVRSLSRQQQALSLSSCEAELYGLQSVCLESVAFGRLVHRLLFALHEIDEPEEVVIWLESDSSSALQLVRSIWTCRDARDTLK